MPPDFISSAHPDIVEHTQNQNSMHRKRGVQDLILSSALVVYMSELRVKGSLKGSSDAFLTTLTKTL